MNRLITHLKLPNGTYQGEVMGVESIRHGMGQMNYDDGSFFEGQWMNDKRNGHGILYFASGNVYQGYFVNNQKEGYGEFYYARNEEYYKGYWIGDKKHGQGEYHFRNGDKFEGFFVQDMKHGPGVKTTKSMRLEGVWENNLKNGSFEFVNLKSGKQGIIFYRDNKKVGIQSSRSMFGEEGFRLEGSGEQEMMSSYTNSYGSPGQNWPSSNPKSNSKMKNNLMELSGEMPRPQNKIMSYNELTQVLGTQDHSYQNQSSYNPNSMNNLENKIPAPPMPVLSTSQGSLENGLPMPLSFDSVPPIKGELQMPPHSTMGNTQKKVKDNASFKSYGSRTIKTNSQGTFNSSAKTSMKAFYDYKEFKDGMSKGQLNLKMLKEEEEERNKNNQVGFHQIPRKQKKFEDHQVQNEENNLNIESMSRERFTNQEPTQGMNPSLQNPDFGYGFAPPPPYKKQSFQFGLGTIENNFPSNKLAQIEESPELKFGGTQGFVKPNFQNLKNENLGPIQPQGHPDNSNNIRMIN